MARRRNTEAPSPRVSKPRSDARLLNLPEEQKAQLVEWLLSGVPYHQAALLVKEQFGVSVRLGAYTDFWRDVCLPVLSERRRQFSQSARVRSAEAKADPGTFQDATIDAIKEKAYQLATAANTSPKDVKALFVLVQKEMDRQQRAAKEQADRELKQRQLTLEERRITLLEKKAALVDEAEAVTTSSALTDEQKLARYREIFGTA